jgi:hypothetical protein
MAGLRQTRERNRVIWVLLGIALWVCLSLPLALVVGAVLRPRSQVPRA